MRKKIWKSAGMVGFNYGLVLVSVGGLSGCIPTPIPRVYSHGALLPAISGRVVDDVSGAPIADVEMTVEYAGCRELFYSEPDSWVYRDRSHPPAAWLAQENSVLRRRTVDSDRTGTFELSARDTFTFVVIPLVPMAPVGEFYDPYAAPYRVVLRHPDYGVQVVYPADEIRLKKSRAP